MGDIFFKNRDLNIKKFERDKAKYKTAILEKEVRIMELYETIEQLKVDIEIDEKKVIEMDQNIKQQIEAKEKEG